VTTTFDGILIGHCRQFICLLYDSTKNWKNKRLNSALVLHLVLFRDVQAGGITCMQNLSKAAETADAVLYDATLKQFEPCLVEAAAPVPELADDDDAKPTTTTPPPTSNAARSTAISAIAAAAMMLVLL
jgi:hypothetical protein